MHTRVWSFQRKHDDGGVVTARREWRRRRKTTGATPACLTAARTTHIRCENVKGMNTISSPTLGPAFVAYKVAASCSSPSENLVDNADRRKEKPQTGYPVVRDMSSRPLQQSSTPYFFPPKNSEHARMFS